MKIKTKLTINKLIDYLLTHRDYYNDKFRIFTSSNENCKVKINNSDIYIEFNKYNDFELEKDLFTIDIDIDIKKHVFNMLEFYYKDHLNGTFKSDTLAYVTIDDVLANFDCPLESKLMIIYQNKVIYNNGKVIEHE